MAPESSVSVQSQTPYGAEEILKEIDNRRRHTLPASKLSQLSRGED